MRHLTMGPLTGGIATLATGTKKYSGTTNTVTWEIYSDGTLVLKPTNGESGRLSIYTGPTAPPWSKYASEIKRAEITGNVILPVGSSAVFYKLTELTAITGLENLDISEATKLSNMFLDCSSLTSLNVSGWDTGNVTNMRSLFSNCGSLTTPASLEGIGGCHRRLEYQ